MTETCKKLQKHTYKMRFEYFSDIYDKKLQFRYTVFRIAKDRLSAAEMPSFTTQKATFWKPKDVG